MSISTFRSGSRQNTMIKLPLTRNDKAVWHPQINDKFPDFTAPSTKGKIIFSDWARGSWVLFVSHPGAFTPVCTSEIGALAKRQSEFAERRVKIIALTADPLDRIQKWTDEIEDMMDVRVTFPHIADQYRVIAMGCGLVAQDQSANGKQCARRSFLIDPTGTIRMIMDYPVTVGRSVDETLRAIDALILSDRLEALTPSDWHIGEPMLLAQEEPQSDLQRRLGLQVQETTAYFRTMDLDRAPARAKRNKASVFPDISTREISRLATKQKCIIMTRLVNFPDR